MTDLRQAAMHQVSEFAQAQEQAEPTPWRDMVVVSLVREGIDKHKARELADHFAAQQQAEPVAWRVWSPDGTNVYQYTEDGDGEPLYTTPPQRPWVGLTDEEATKIWESTDDKDSWELLKRVEAKLKAKNDH